MSPDDVVSNNLRRARELRGWTQPEAAQRISRYLGREWSQQVYGDAERAYRGKRVKNFSAEEIVAFCRAFRLPVVWFYLPPDPWTAIVPKGAAVDSEAALTSDELLSLIFPRLDDQMLVDLDSVTVGLFSSFTAHVPRAQNTAAYLEWVSRQNAALRSMVRAAFEAESIDDLPEQLEELASRVRRSITHMVSDMMHSGIPGDPSDSPSARAPDSP